MRHRRLFRLGRSSKSVSRARASSARDLAPTCAVRIYVGAGIPGGRGRYRELPASFDSRAFRSTVERLVGAAFPNVTYVKTRGAWKGGGEDGYMAEVLMRPARYGCRTLFERAERVAAKIARSLGQEAVMLVVTDADGSVRQDLVHAA